MPFKTGQSGNPKGRAKGSLNRRTQLVKLIEPHAEELVAKMIGLALDGDVTALRLCIERLIPKIRHEPIEIELPTNMNEKNLSKFKSELLLAALEGKMSIDDIEKMIKLIDSIHQKQISLPLALEIPKDISPIEASKIYQQLMQQN
jgi:hypothetical protein